MCKARQIICWNCLKYSSLIGVINCARYSTNLCTNTVVYYKYRLCVDCETCNKNEDYVTMQRLNLFPKSNRYKKK